MARDPWFTVERLDEETFAVSEYRHWEETHCYLLCGRERGLLIDAGLGVGDLRGEVEGLTGLPVVAAVTHVHWDHIGGFRQFPHFFAPAEELDWLRGAFPLPVKTIRNMLSDRCALPESFDVGGYELFQGEPTRLLSDGDVVDLGGRRIEALHTPGHSPGHLCFWEPERGYLFTGDLVYRGTLYADYPSTDPEAYLASLERIAALPARRLFPGHHALDIAPELVVRMRDALRALKAGGKLRHGAGVQDFGDWSIAL
ncbi:MAG: MBL fold metallo-hydrolase [Ruminococcaceae bacterium]|nr:MBL fold metallo-hydrolase [Oscillospiraceae bacterium]